MKHPYWMRLSEVEKDERVIAEWLLMGRYWNKVEIIFSLQSPVRSCLRTVRRYLWLRSLGKLHQCRLVYLDTLKHINSTVLSEDKHDSRR